MLNFLAEHRAELDHDSGSEDDGEQAQAVSLVAAAKHRRLQQASQITIDVIFAIGYSAAIPQRNMMSSSKLFSSWNSIV